MLTLRSLPHEWAVVRLPAEAALPSWALAGPFFSITRTPDELSIVCLAAQAPATAQAERGWRALQVAGPLAFELVGILASLLAPLQAAGISVFAISTYETDYLLIKEAQWPQALAALEAAGHQIAPGDDATHSPRFLP